MGHPLVPVTSTVPTRRRTLKYSLGCHRPRAPITCAKLCALNNAQQILHAQYLHGEHVPNTWQASVTMVP